MARSHRNPAPPTILADIWLDHVVREIRAYRGKFPAVFKGQSLQGWVEWKVYDADAIKSLAQSLEDAQKARAKRIKKLAYNSW